MPEYISAQEAAKKRGISERRGQKAMRRKPHTSVAKSKKADRPAK